MNCIGSVMFSSWGVYLTVKEGNSKCFFFLSSGSVFNSEPSRKQTAFLTEADSQWLQGLLVFL